MRLARGYSRRISASSSDWAAAPRPAELPAVRIAVPAAGSRMRANPARVWRSLAARASRIVRLRTCVGSGVSPAWLARAASATAHRGTALPNRVTSGRRLGGTRSHWGQAESAPRPARPTHDSPPTALRRRRQQSGSTAAASNKHKSSRHYTCAGVCWLPALMPDGSRLLARRQTPTHPHA
eukprot:scaffold10687_cov121-Isochrysis_galbana.AAC.5